MEEPKRYVIRRVSQLTGKLNEMEMELTSSQFRAVLAWNKGEGPNIQDILPYHTPEVREFLMTGLSIEEQNMLFGECE